MLRSTCSVTLYELRQQKKPQSQSVGPANPRRCVCVCVGGVSQIQAAYGMIEEEKQIALIATINAITCTLIKAMHCCLGLQPWETKHDILRHSLLTLSTLPAITPHSHCHTLWFREPSSSRERKMFNVGPHRPYPKAASPVRGSVWSCSRLKLDVWGAIARERGSRSSWSVSDGAEFKARLSNRDKRESPASRAFLYKV